MNKKILPLSLFALLLLSGCISTSSSSFTSSSSSLEESSLSSKEESSSSSTQSLEKSSKREESSSSVEKSSSIEKESASSSSKKENIDYKYDLTNWTTFSFYDEYGPTHNKDFTYYYGSSKNPNGVLYTCPNEKANADGVHFEKYTQYMVSPTFKSWKKVEIRFALYFVSKSSTSYKSKKNEPQIIIEKYDCGDELIGNEEIYLTKSNIPQTGTTYEKQIYIRDLDMSYYKFKFNNTIANGESGYTIVVHEIAMKGWDYE